MNDEGAAPGRRSVIVGTLAAFGAWVARGAVQPAVAADGDAVRLGQRNTAASTTRIVDTTASSTAVRARASGPGAIGLEGESAQGTGVHGLSRDASGVQGESVFGIGVSGHSIEPGSTAVSGESTDGVGVQGGSHNGVGVQGNSQFSVAVRGGNVSETEPAMQGWAQNGQTGVMGRSTAFDEFDPIVSPLHVGVFGVADRPSGRGVLARSRDGRALQANGRVRFSTSGLVTIPQGGSEVTVTPAFRVVGSAKVLATAQGDPGGAAAVRFVTIDPTANAFTVHMTEPVAAPTPVAWFVLD
jgi:hypothetical protein